MDDILIMPMSSERADLSFTVFLNRKDNYDGGSLSIESLNSEDKFKRAAGEIIIYQVHIYIQWRKCLMVKD